MAPCRCAIEIVVPAAGELSLTQDMVHEFSNRQNIVTVHAHAEMMSILQQVREEWPRNGRDDVHLLQQAAWQPLGSRVPDGLARSTHFQPAARLGFARRP